MSGGTYRESENGLPALFTLRDFEGSLSDYFERLYWHYEAFAKAPGVVLWGRPVKVPAGVEADGRDSTFWHMVTRDSRYGAKLDIRKAAFLPRLRDLLERAAEGDPSVVWFRERCPRGWTVHVCPKDFSLNVVLRQCRHNFVLVTAYPTGPGNARISRRAAASWRRGHSRHDTFSHVLWNRRPSVCPAPVARWDAFAA